MRPTSTNDENKKYPSNINENYTKENDNLNKHLSLVRKRIIVFLILSVFLINYLVISSEGDTKKFYENITNVVTSSLGVIIGTLMLTRISKNLILSNIKNKALLSFTIGLFLWLLAHSLWAYNVVGLGIDAPFPSPSDAIWILGYIFFGYYFFVMNRLFRRQGEEDILIHISLTTAIALGYIYILTFGVAELVSAQHDVLATILSILYPMLDGALLIPSISILCNTKNKDPSSLLWILLSLSMISFIGGDIYFGYGSMLGIENLGVTSIFYNVGYLAISFGLFWHYKLSKPY